MIIPNKYSGYTRDGIRRMYMGGGDAPTSTTVNQSNIPEYLRPQVETLLGGSMKELFQTKEIPGVDGAPSTFEIVGTKPFTPYSSNVQDYVAGFSPLQQQVQQNAANLQMPGQFNYATDMANAAGQGGLDSAGRAYGYGNAGFQSGQQGQQMGMQGGDFYGSMGADYGTQAADIGQMGLRAERTGRQIGNLAQGYAADAASAGSDYAKAAQNVYNPRTGQYDTSSAIGAYMSPYQQNVTDLQNEAAQRQADIASTQRGAQFARAGAYGGARQAIENAEADRALQSTMNMNQAQGLQNAYNQAQQNLQYGSNLGLQGLQGAQQGLGTALQGGQLGLSGIGTALQGLQGGMQGAGIGLQGIDRQLAGTAQGMQGAGMGLQGVSGAQAGYGLANQAASNLANIGTQQLAGQTGILNLQNQIGGEQQNREQQLINQAISNFGQAEEAPMQRYNQFNSLVRGYALPGTTTTQYQAQPSVASQIAGAGTALYGASNLAKGKKGGKVSAKEGIDKLALRRALQGA